MFIQAQDRNLYNVSLYAAIYISESRREQKTYVRLKSQVPAAHDPIIAVLSFDDGRTSVPEAEALLVEIRRAIGEGVGAMFIDVDGQIYRDDRA